MNTPRILITAATGKTGTPAIKELRQQGIAVRAMAHKKEFDMFEAIILASLFTSVMWLPYLLGSTVARGLGSTLAGDPKSDSQPLPAWVKSFTEI